MLLTCLLKGRALCRLSSDPAATRTTAVLQHMRKVLHVLCPSSLAFPVLYTLIFSIQDVTRTALPIYNILNNVRFSGFKVFFYDTSQNGSLSIAKHSLNSFHPSVFDPQRALHQNKVNKIFPVSRTLLCKKKTFFFCFPYYVKLDSFQ